MMEYDTFTTKIPQKSLHILLDMLHIYVTCSTTEGTGFRYLHSRFPLVFTNWCYKWHTIFIDNGTYKMAFLWYCRLLSQMSHRFLLDNSTYKMAENVLLCL